MSRKDRRFWIFGKGTLARAATLTALAIASTACSAPRYDIYSVEGKAAILDEVRGALNSADCQTAIASIEVLYNSTASDNEVRLARASAQGCAAGVSNFLELLGDISSKTAELAGPGFWKVLTELFYLPSNDDLDRRITAGGQATDALFAAIPLGTVVARQNQVNVGTHNVGSLLAADRVSDANAYLIFISMAMIGTLQSRYGSPDGSYAPMQILGATSTNTNGWTDATKVDEDGCAYAASVLNLLDALNETSEHVTGAVADSMKGISSTFSSVIEEACQMGCSKGTSLTGLDYTVTGCTLTAGDCAGTSGRACPLALRDRTACKREVDDAASCAAAGIAHFVSNDPLGGWQ